MIYSEKVKLAMNISYKAHLGQYDKGGYPYCYHPYHLAESLSSEEEIIVALLHDVMEDHPDACSWDAWKRVSERKSSKLSAS